jgi:hypothetical protein
MGNVIINEKNNGKTKREKNIVVFAIRLVVMRLETVKLLATMVRT